MFGVLIVRTSNGQMGYLAAFSGNLCGSNSHSFFVPPVYDLLQPDGFFKIEEEQISAINRRIGQLQNSDRYVKLQQRLAKETASSQQILTEARKTLKTAKEKREQRRQQQPDEDEQAAMIRESQYQKAEFKRLERYWKERISEVKAELESISSQIESLKAERKTVRRHCSKSYSINSAFECQRRKQELVCYLRTNHSADTTCRSR